MAALTRPEPVLIEAKNLGKQYRLFDKPLDRLKEALVARYRGKEESELVHG